MNFETIISRASKALPGVTFRLRKLNHIELTKRDFEIMEHQLRLAELIARQRSLTMDPSEAQTERIVPDEAKPECARINREVQIIIELYVKPSTIRAAFVDVSGITLDEKPVTIDNLLSSGPQELIDEIWDASTETLGLSEDQLKN